MQMDANAFLPIYIDIDIHIGIDIDRDLSIYKDRNIDLNKTHLVVRRFRASVSNPMPDFFMIHNLIGMVRKGTALLFLEGEQVSYGVLHPKKKVNIRHFDGV